MSEPAKTYYGALRPDRPARPALRENTKASVAIVGGGLAGLTTAFNLASAGQSVVLLEAKTCCFGASGRNAGFVSPGYAQSILTVERIVGRDHSRKLFALSRQGRAFVERQLGELNLADQISGQGWLKVLRHDDPDSLRRLQQRMTTDFGVDLQFWSKDDVRGTLQTGRYFAALHDPEPIHINPLSYGDGLAAAAEAQGAMLFENSEALGLERVGRAGGAPAGWRVRTEQGSVSADHVVLAGSAYQSGLYRPLENAVLPVATFVAVTKPMGEQLNDVIRFPGCIADTRRAGDYYRIVGSCEGQRLLWGGRITTANPDQARLGALLISDILSVYPQLAPINLDYVWSGLMGYPRSKMPVIGLLAGTDRSGLWCATAFGGHGLNTTAVGGAMISEAILRVSDNWRLFDPFMPSMLDKVLGGRNLLGRSAIQLEYWRMQALDRWQERS